MNTILWTGQNEECDSFGVLQHQTHQQQTSGSMDTAQLDNAQQQWDRNVCDFGEQFASMDCPGIGGAEELFVQPHTTTQQTGALPQPQVQMQHRMQQPLQHQHQILSQSYHQSHDQLHDWNPGINGGVDGVQQNYMAGKCGKIFVGGLPPSCGKVELRDYFSAFGTILDCVVMFDKDNRHRGFGFITFSSEHEKEAVMAKYDQHYLGKKWIEVKRCIPKDDADLPHIKPPASQGRMPRSALGDDNTTPCSLSLGPVDAVARDLETVLHQTKLSEDRALSKVFNILGELRVKQNELATKIERLKQCPSYLSAFSNNHGGSLMHGGSNGAGAASTYGPGRPYHPSLGMSPAEMASKLHSFTSPAENYVLPPQQLNGMYGMQALHPSPMMQAADPTTLMQPEMKADPVLQQPQTQQPQLPQHQQLQQLQHQQHVQQQQQPHVQTLYQQPNHLVPPSQGTRMHNAQGFSPQMERLPPQHQPQMQYVDPMSMDANPFGDSPTGSPR